MQITTITRYPVKSLQGESLDEAQVDAHGIAGDRGWAVVDLVTGKTLTSRRQPELLFAAARVVGDDVVITLPDGIETNDDATLSSWLGHDVALRKAASDLQGTYEIQLDFETGEWFEWQGPEGSFHDSTRTLISLVSASAMREWDPRRFRMNVVLDADGDVDLVGGQIRVGDDGPLLDITKEVDRCIVTTRPQPGLDRDLDVLRAINADRSGNLGIGALIIEPGTIAIGDTLHPT